MGENGITGATGRWFGSEIDPGVVAQEGVREGEGSGVDPFEAEE